MSTQTTSELYEKLQLSTLGIDAVDQIFYQPSYDELYDHEQMSTNQGYEKGQRTSFGAVSVDTGKFTGRSAKDKYIVMDDQTQDSVWWESQGSTNKPLSQEAWNQLKTCSFDGAISPCTSWSDRRYVKGARSKVNGGEPRTGRCNACVQR